jgi:hypothetical protein
MRFYAVDPQEQTASPYLFCGNSPVMFVDPDGEFFIPILVGMAYGAIAGAAVSGGTYALMAGDEFTWDTFSEAALSGAIGGAVSGGFGAAGTMLGSQGNNMAYGILSNTTSYAVSSAIKGEDISVNGLIGSTVGGAIGGTIPGFSGVEGGALKNITSELIYNSAKGALAGGLGGAINAAISGYDIRDGFIQGAQYGAASSFVQTGLTQIALGHAIKPKTKRNSNAIRALNEIEADAKASGNNEHIGNYKPVYRSGGLWGFVMGGRGGAIGRNLVVPKNSSSDYENYTFVHETAHYYQQIQMGFSNFLGRVFFFEQLLYGWDQSCYTKPGFMEWGADSLSEIYGLKYW